MVERNAADPLQWSPFRIEGETEDEDEDDEELKRCFNGAPSE